MVGTVVLVLLFVGLNLKTSCDPRAVRGLWLLLSLLGLENLVLPFIHRRFSWEELMLEKGDRVGKRLGS